MPEVEYSTVVAAPVERVWEYVEDLNRWCHLMVGYEALEIIDDRHSVWTLRGDVGILSREVKVQVDITEWIPRERVSFVVNGLTERLDGSGAFLMQRASDGGDGPGAPGATGEQRSGTPGSASIAAQRGPSVFRRLQSSIARSILRRLGRKAAKRRAALQAAAGTGPAASAPASPSAGSPGAPTSGAPASEATGSAYLTFQLRVRPLGPMAPMLEVLMAPMLEPAAKDLADGIRAAVET
jgi:hypothetical protein